MDSKKKIQRKPRKHTSKHYTLNMKKYYYYEGKMDLSPEKLSSAHYEHTKQEVSKYLKEVKEFVADNQHGALVDLHHAYQAYDRLVEKKSTNKENVPQSIVKIIEHIRKTVADKFLNKISMENVGHRQMRFILGKTKAKLIHIALHSSNMSLTVHEPFVHLYKKYAAVRFELSMLQFAYVMATKPAVAEKYKEAAQTDEIKNFAMEKKGETKKPKKEAAKIDYTPVNKRLSGKATATTSTAPVSSKVQKMLDSLGLLQQKQTAKGGRKV